MADTADPSTGTIPIGYLIPKATIGHITLHAGGYVWEVLEAYWAGQRFLSRQSPVAPIGGAATLCTASAPGTSCQLGGFRETERCQTEPTPLASHQIPNSSVATAKPLRSTHGAEGPSSQPPMSMFIPMIR